MHPITKKNSIQKKQHPPFLSGVNPVHCLLDSDAVQQCLLKPQHRVMKCFKNRLLLDALVWVYFFPITCYYSELIFYIFKGWYVYPAFPCLSWMVCLISVMVMSVHLDACWWSLYSFCGGLGHQSQYICGVVWGGSRARKTPNPAQLPPQTTPHIYWYWWPKPPQKLYRDHQQASS